MKKLVTLLTTLLLSTTVLTGCVGDGGMTTANFEKVCHHDYVTFYRDIDTDIMYLEYALNSNHNGITVYCNAEGKPMTYKEFQQVHIAKYHKD